MIDENFITFTKKDDSCKHESINEYYDVHVNKRYKTIKEASDAVKSLLSALKLKKLINERIELFKSDDSCVVYSALQHLQSLVEESEK